MDIEKILLKCAVPVKNRLIRYALWVIYAILILLHNFSLKGLEKPAGLIEAFKFMFKDPGNYMSAFFCGLLAYPIPIIIFISLISAVIVQISDIQDNDYSYDDVDNKMKIWEFIIVVIVMISMAILNHIYINYVVLLGFALFVLFGFIYLIFNND